MRTLIKGDKYEDIAWGIKFHGGNSGMANGVLTLPWSRVAPSPAPMLSPYSCLRPVSTTAEAQMSRVPNHCQPLTRWPRISQSSSTATTGVK